MTDLPTYEELSDEQVATMIAEEMGWELLASPQDGEGVLIPEWLSGVGHFTYTGFTAAEVPNQEIRQYTVWNPRHSLDQCWIFEEWLIKNRHSDYEFVYVEHIVRICKENPVKTTGLFIHATSNQRCEAFYVTMGGKE